MPGSSQVRLSLVTSIPHLLTRDDAGKSRLRQIIGGGIHPSLVRRQPSRHPHHVRQSVAQSSLASSVDAVMSGLLLHGLWFLPHQALRLLGRHLGFALGMGSGSVGRMRLAKLAAANWRTAFIRHRTFLVFARLPCFLPHVAGHRTPALRLRKLRASRSRQPGRAAPRGIIPFPRVVPDARRPVASTSLPGRLSSDAARIPWTKYDAPHRRLVKAGRAMDVHGYPVCHLQRSRRSAALSGQGPRSPRGMYRQALPLRTLDCCQIASTNRINPHVPRRGIVSSWINTRPPASMPEAGAAVVRGGISLGSSSRHHNLHRRCGGGPRDPLVHPPATPWRLAGPRAARSGS